MSTPTTTAWFLSSTDHPEPARNVPAGVEYHRVLAGEKRRVLRGLLAILLLAVGLVVFSTVFRNTTIAIDASLGHDPTAYTPLRHAGGMLGLALLMPWSMLIQRVLYRVPGSSMHSVISRFRFDLLGRALVVLGPVWVTVKLVEFFQPGAEMVPWSPSDLVAMLLVTVVLTPLQTTGEEYGLRGLMLRVIASWTRSSTLGLVIGLAVTGVSFTLVHGSLDPYVFGWYMMLWTALGIITWRTGGLEVAVVLHAVLNTATFVAGFVLHVDFDSAINSREDVVGQPYQLIPGVVAMGIAALIWWWTRKTGPALTPQQVPGGRTPTPSLDQQPDPATR